MKIASNALMLLSVMYKELGQGVRESVFQTQGEEPQSL